MKKLVLLAVIVVLLGGGAALSLGSVASSAIERGGQYALGVPTEVDDVELGLFSGRFGLSGLRVANPPGFDEPHLLTLDGVDLSVGLGSLTSDLVEVPALVVDGLTITLERGAAGMNVTPVMKSLERFGGDGAGDPGPGAEEGGRRFVVRELRIEDTRARLALAPALGSLGRTELEVPLIVLEDVGASEADGGQSLPELVATIVTAVLDALASQGGLPAEFQQQLDAGLARLGELQQELDAARARLEGGLGQLGEQLEQAQEELGDVGKKVDEALDDLLGGKKKKKADG